MFRYIFELPLVVSGPAIVIGLSLFAMSGLVFVRKRILPHWRVNPADSEFAGAMVQSIFVFYGIALALIAVSVWQTYSDVSKVVSEEATALAALYRDVTGYPLPLREELQQQLKEYTRYIVHEAWPTQRQGRVPTDGIQQIDRFQVTLVKFEPATEGQKLLHAETLRAYNHMLLFRRMRLDAVDTGLPSVMWLVVAAGALISVTSSFFFKIEDIRIHAVFVALLATFIGLVIFMTLALDHPFRGDLGIGSQPYQLIYEQLMKRQP